ncbi:hypothetical protein ACFXPA_47935, partial [Amycolatopsis sp. NPDC059090]|uniref:hypothetical protein n=1 Tax=Amycolatopsis sp. NPDC059090 TaxID=3346723 RepID=UPI00366E3C0E
WNRAKPTFRPTTSLRSTSYVHTGAHERAVLRYGAPRLVFTPWAEHNKIIAAGQHGTYPDLAERRIAAHLDHSRSGHRRP